MNKVLMTVAIAALGLSLGACSKDEKEQANIPSVETPQSLRTIRPGTGKACPPVQGRYSCVDENSAEVREIEYVQGTDDQGRPVFSQKGNIPTDRKLVTRAFEFYVMSVEGGVIADGSIQDKSINFLTETLNLRYSVSCSDKILSLQVITGDTGVRTTVERADNGNLKIDNWQTAGDGVQVGRSQCQKLP
ncbi:MAG: hypothetical protein K2Q26_07115 [Bdellovibrionales bacterium]|nr:hypothetical protein [Bdellovibrionales bacterium]